MSVKFDCETCGKTLRAPHDAGGRMCRCPSCGTETTIPTRHAAADPPAYTVRENTRECPFCSETIKLTAIKCKHCGSDLNSPGGAATAGPAFQQNPLYDQSQRESMLFDGTPSQWTNLGKYLFTGFLALIGLLLSMSDEITGWIPVGLIVVSGFVALKAYINTRFSVYRVTTERIEMETGWISKQIDNLDLFRIQDVRVKVSVFDRIVGIGNVIIVSSDDTDPVMLLKGIHDPRGLYDKLKKETVKADRRRGVLHIES